MPSAPCEKLCGSLCPCEPPTGTVQLLGHHPRVQGRLADLTIGHLEDRVAELEREVERRGDMATILATRVVRYRRERDEAMEQATYWREQAFECARLAGHALGTSRLLPATPRKPCP